MSYTITLKAEGGQVQVTDASGDIPEGSWSVTGHEGAPVQVSGGTTVRDRSIAVTRSGPDGRYVTSAQHYDQVVT
jgi:hypothetical protein